jgi:hypothetical protein
MDDCSICLDEVCKDNGVACDRGHTLHWQCYRELVRSVNYNRPNCPTCRCWFACAICEGGSQVICITCMRDKLKIVERPLNPMTPAVCAIMHQHAMFWAVFFGAWTLFRMEQKKRMWYDDASELLPNVLFFVNFHFNVWMCCDRVLEALVIDAPLGDSRNARVYYARLTRIKCLHKISKRCIWWLAMVRMLFFIYDAVLLLDDSDYLDLNFLY